MRKEITPDHKAMLEKIINSGGVAEVKVEAQEVSIVKVRRELVIGKKRTKNH